MFGSDFLGSCDIEDGKDLRAVIKAVTIKAVKGPDGKEQDRNVASFTDPKIKPMILNSTNCKLIKKFSKSVFINDWCNIPVAIYVKDDVRAFGEVTEGLRIRPIQPVMDKPKLTPKLPAWAKAIEFLSKDGTIEMIKEKYDISAADEKSLKEAVK